MGIIHPFELLETFGHGLPLGFAALHFRDEGVELKLVLCYDSLPEGGRLPELREDSL